MHPTNRELRRLKQKYKLTNPAIAKLLSTATYAWGEETSIYRVNNWLRFEGRRMDPIILEKLCHELGEEINTQIILEP